MCALEFALAPLIPDSSTAEQSTVNRQVLGSNPSQGAQAPQSLPQAKLKKVRHDLTYEV